MAALGSAATATAWPRGAGADKAGALLGRWGSRAAAAADGDGSDKLGHMGSADQRGLDYIGAESSSEI